MQTNVTIYEDPEARRLIEAYARARAGHDSQNQTIDAYNRMAGQFSGYGGLLGALMVAAGGWKAGKAKDEAEQLAAQMMDAQHKLNLHMTQKDFDAKIAEMEQRLQNQLKAYGYQNELGLESDRTNAELQTQKEKELYDYKTQKELEMQKRLAEMKGQNENPLAKMLTPEEQLAAQMGLIDPMEVIKAKAENATNKYLPLKDNVEKRKRELLQAGVPYMDEDLAAKVATIEAQGGKPDTILKEGLKLNEARKSATAIIENLKGIVDEYGQFGTLDSTLHPDVKGKIDSYVNGLVTAMSQFSNTGTLNEGEYERFKQTIGDITGNNPFMPKSLLKAKLDALEDIINKQHIKDLKAKERAGRYLDMVGG